MNVRWTPDALAQLRALQDYLGQDSSATAELVTDRVRRAVEGLADYPPRGRPGRIVGTRELVIARTSQIVASAVRGDLVEILALLHAARQWPESFE